MLKLTCIICPRGCELKIDEKLNVTGNSCSRGAKYAVSEVTNPVRSLTTTVKVASWQLNRLPVKTKTPVPKAKMSAIMDFLRGVQILPPVRTGDVIVKDILNLGVDIVATRTILE